jgi:hypothetical protein
MRSALRKAHPMAVFDKTLDTHNLLIYLFANYFCVKRILQPCRNQRADTFIVSGIFSTVPVCLGCADLANIFSVISRGQTEARGFFVFKSRE